jgi:hypothetical protein
MRSPIPIVIVNKPAWSTSTNRPVLSMKYPDANETVASGTAIASMYRPDTEGLRLSTIWKYSGKK